VTGAEPSTPALRVLVAEDNTINQQIVGRLLAAAGHAVTLVDDGAQAVAAAAGALFDVVLMDVHMPVLDGLEATRRIRALPAPHGRTRIVALTANAGDDAAKECLAAGMNDHVAKPIDPTALLAKLVAVGGGAPRVEAAAPVGSNATLDPAALEGLAAAMGPDGLIKLVQLYLDEAARRLRDITELSQRGDLAAAAREAHALVSISGGVGAMQVSALSRALEQACLAADASSAARLEAELNAASRDADQGLRAWLGARVAS
jgi:two-component system sensor histidine kinase/response regulator